VKNIIKIVKKSEKFKNKIKCCIGYFLLSRTRTEQEHCALTICAVTSCDWMINPILSSDWLEANHTEKLNHM